MTPPDGGASSSGSSGGHGFGTGPVFLASLSTILGAIMFLRFGYAVGNVGLAGALAIILLGHLVTVPTALAIAEIATNRRVEGGGEYYIISRSFGHSIGGAIGIALFLSQAISVGFYMVAFAEAFRPLMPWLQARAGIELDFRMISVPATLALVGITLTRGAAVGVRALWVVVAILLLSLVMFFLGGPPEGVAVNELSIFPEAAAPDPFILVFAICFPAFTGMTAGVGLSGDLRNPRRSIPLGILSATVVGMLVYVALVVKLSVSAPPEMLADTERLVMADIALWGPIIPIGLACATLSSALGSVLVAPRTLQAIAGDRILPSVRANRLLAAGVGDANEPRNATLVTGVLAFVIVWLGSVDLAARVISMFFMVTYGALCAVSFLEHFAARPSYRPSFRSKWYISLFGAVVCLLTMFQMGPMYAVVAIVLMMSLYVLIHRSRGGRHDLSNIFGGVMAQATRYLQIKLQKNPTTDDWRPSVISITPRTFDRASPLQFMSWLCDRYGFGTYLHFIPGKLERRTFLESAEVHRRLVEATAEKHSELFVDTIISPSMATALAQSLQLPGVSGIENNSILFEYSVHDGPDVLAEVDAGLTLASVPGLNRLILRHGDHFFGNRRNIHVWLTWHDYRNANLMILLAYILLGHRDWRDGEISVFAAYPHERVAERTAELDAMIDQGRLHLSRKNVQVIPTDDRIDFGRLVQNRSAEADLVVLGFTEDRRLSKGPELFRRHQGLGDVLFVCAAEQIEIE